MPDNILNIIGAVAPTVGVIATGGFGYLAARSNNLNKTQFGELKQGMADIEGRLTTLQNVADDNRSNLKAVKATWTISKQRAVATVIPYTRTWTQLLNVVGQRWKSVERLPSSLRVTRYLVAMVRLKPCTVSTVNCH